MRLLFVTPWLPHPEIMHAGGQHVYHTVRSLIERGHEVSLICYGRGESRDTVAVLARLCRELRVVEPAYSFRQKFRQLRAGLFDSLLSLGRRTHLEVQAAIPTVCRRQHIQVVHLCWTETSRYAPFVPDGVGIVLGTMDVEYLVRPREVALYNPGWQRLQKAWVAHQAVRLERRFLPEAHAILACSAADRRHLAHLASPERIFLVPPWIDIGRASALDRWGWMPGRLTFMGAMDRFANEAAVRFLLAAVWPEIRERHPHTTLTIAGASPPGWLARQARSDFRLQLTGQVPDLAGVWAATDIAVSPSLIGGGLITKVAQPMAAARPVVTTTLGNEGVAAQPNEEVAVADDGPAFVRALDRLLTDPEFRSRLAENGRRRAQKQFDWSAALDTLEDTYRAAVAAGQGTP